MLSLSNEEAQGGESVGGGQTEAAVALVEQFWHG